MPHSSGSSSRRKQKGRVLAIAGGIIGILVLAAAFQKLFRPARPATSSAGSCVSIKPDAPVRILIHVSPGLVSFYDDYNELFARKWLCATGERVTIQQSYGTSGNQMRSVLRGDVVPDVITMSNTAEMQAIADQAGIVSQDWRSELPYESSPFYSAVVFVVRKGNPKNIRDWGDLIRPGVQIAVSNPKTCGGGRWVYDAALGYGQSLSRAGRDRTREFLTAFYAHVPELYADQGAAGKAFFQENKGDVLTTYEAVGIEQLSQPHPSVDIVVPPRTVSIDMPVTIARRVTDKRGTTDLAVAYVTGLYDPSLRQLMANNYLRQRGTTNDRVEVGKFPPLTLFHRTDVFGKGFDTERAHLGDGGIFDAIRAATTPRQD